MDKIPQNEQAEDSEVNERQSSRPRKPFYCDICNIMIVLLIIVSVMGTIRLKILKDQDSQLQEEIAELQRKTQQILNLSIENENQNLNEFIKNIQWYQQEKIKADMSRRMARLPVKLPEIPTNYSRLIGMGRPRQTPRAMMLVTVSKDTNEIDSICPVFNAISIVSKNCALMVDSFLKAGVKRVVMIVDAKEYLLYNVYKEELANYNISQRYVAVDSNYKFIRDEIKSSSKIVFIQNTFTFSAQNIMTILKYAGVLQPYAMVYTSSIGIDTNGEIKKEDLRDLNTTNLESVIDGQINKYLFLFDARFFNFVTPINFAYINMFTVEEMFIYPIVAILQGTSKLTQLTETVHSLKENFQQFVEFQLIQRNDSQLNLCFLSFPNNPYKASASDLSEYLSTLTNSGDKSGLYLIVYAVYDFSDSTSNDRLYDIFSKIAQFKEFDTVRLRIWPKKAPVALGAYESTHTYCPSHSLMISSRQNVRFDHLFVRTLRKDVNEKDSYYMYKFRDEAGYDLELQNNVEFASKFRSQALHLQTHLMHLQIFKSDLFRMLHLWALKSDEIDFYQTEASFLFPLMELIDFKFMSSNISFYRVRSRKISAQELKQIHSLQLYSAHPVAKMIAPCFYNSLNNIVFRRSPANWIPKKIHQLWLGEAISPLRKALSETFKLKNPDYEYILWTAENITIENFPYSYSTVMRILNYEKRTNAVNLAAASNLLRYEILYQNGGIYADMNIECKKSLDPFLKYQIFFSEPYYWYPGTAYVKQFEHSFMGACRFSYYLNILLSILVSDFMVKENEPEFVEQTGGYMLRRVFNDEQIYTVPGFGMRLFNPVQNGTGLCESSTKFTGDQNVFEESQGSLKRKIGIPCAFYAEAFIYRYKSIG